MGQGRGRKVWNGSWMGGTLDALKADRGTAVFWVSLLQMGMNCFFGKTFGTARRAPAVTHTRVNKNSTINCNTRWGLRSVAPPTRACHVSGACGRDALLHFGLVIRSPCTTCCSCTLRCMRHGLHHTARRRICRRWKAGCGA